MNSVVTLFDKTVLIPRLRRAAEDSVDKDTAPNKTRISITTERKLKILVEERKNERQKKS